MIFAEPLWFWGFAVFPFLIFLTALAGFFGSEELASSIVSYLLGVAPEQLVRPLEPARLAQEDVETLGCPVATELPATKRRAQETAGDAHVVG